jgi:hypothetical protein
MNDGRWRIALSAIAVSAPPSDAAAASPLVSITTRASSAALPGGRAQRELRRRARPARELRADERGARVHGEPGRLRTCVAAELRERGRADRQVAHAARHLRVAAPPLRISASASREGRPGWTSWG